MTKHGDAGVRAAQCLPNKNIDTVGFPRLQCVISDQGAVKSSKLHPSTSHIQWRLYRPSKVQYTTALHTPGFLPVASISMVAPIEATMIHLDWSLHSYESRRSKVERYDRHTDGPRSVWKKYYLWEDDKKHGFKNLSNVKKPEFSKTALAIQKQLPQNCITEPRGLHALSN